MRATANSEYGAAAQVDAVRTADPLGADLACRDLVRMNQRADVAALVRGLRALLPELDRVARFTDDECLAAMRDLGMFLGSIKRHGTEPAEAVPEAVPVLAELGRRTGMVPRDTVLHYCVWNPDGVRRRTYTGDAQERVLQDSVRHVFPALRTALEGCDELARADPADARFAELVRMIDGHVAAMVESIDLVLGEVGPVFFARTLRPYFEEITFGGVTYLGPAAAQVPLWLVDEAVWLADDSGDYARFLHESVPYTLPRWRALHARWRGTSSAVTRLVRTVEEAGGVDRAGPGARAGADALVGLLRTLITFRGRHFRIARQAYREDVRLYAVGSGGASIDLLHQVLLLTRQNARMVRAVT
ncbi:monodechloroaminopyrrolnitrin synthase PrnB family protein [Saccharopolyspora rosea]|uniref:monodechloroaminopyrrolnitrin synthase PrnB family protein n=1 Tax=Saccharopolyspora rosea TaxID=524884 RepID=UPI0021D9BA3C|nr:monodechloroaminopyrrolnitrin synthase PrnB family protein [Saccharopolyspora rosea]